MPTIPFPIVTGDVTSDTFSLFRDMPLIGMAVTSPIDKRWLQVNNALCDFLGYTREELLERSWAELTHPDDVEVAVAEFDAVMRGEKDGYQCDKRYIRKDGSIVHAQLVVQAQRAANGQVQLFASTIADITARMVAEQKSRDAAALLAKLSRHVPGVIYQFLMRPDGTTCFPFASEALEEIYEVTPDEVRDDATIVFSRGHPDDLAGAVAAIGESARTLEPWHREFRVFLPKRGMRWIRGEAVPERQADGSTLWHGFLTDVTASRLASQRLEESEARNRILIDHAPEAILVMDLSGQHLIDANSKAEELFGRDRASLLGVEPRALSPEFQPDGRETVSAALEIIAQVARGEAMEFEWTYLDLAGQSIPCEVRMVRMPYDGQTYLRASITDISERLRQRRAMARLQNELLQSQKLESIGRLAGGIAHDFNNLLTVIKASLDLAMPAVNNEHMREDLAEIGRAANSAARLTQQLLAFSRKQVIAPRTLDLEAVIHRTSAMLQRVLGEDIQLEVRTEPHLPAVRFDLGQAEQILVNLAVNARDAMPNGGRLIVEADSVALSQDDATRHSALEPGTYVRLRVTDNGSGMSAETLDHAFEPFYTTKPSGQGTGLGLAMIHGAVQQNHGHVDLTSTVGEGTTCTIWFPCATTGAVAALSESNHALPRGAERLLLVEDDSTVRQLLVRLLEQLGYSVRAFGAGDEALAWLDSANEPIDLLMTDVIMPGMNGKVLSEHVLLRRPGTRVIFASGYTADVIVQQGVVDAGLYFLSKPFSTAELAHSIRQVLDGAPSGVVGTA